MPKLLLVIEKYSNEGRGKGDDVEGSDMPMLSEYCCVMKGSGVFRYQGMKSASFALMGTFFFEILMTVTGLIVFRTEGFSILFVMLPLSGSIVFVVIGIIWLLGCSDFSIDCRGVSWSIYGMVWRQILWKNICVIRVFPTFDYGKASPKLVYTIKPKVRVGFLGRGGSFFDDGISRIDALICLINGYVSEYGIPVEVSKNGVWTHATKLPRKIDFG